LLILDVTSTTARRTNRMVTGMLDDTDRISLTTSTVAKRLPRRQRGPRLRASLTSSGTRGKANVADAVPMARGAFPAGRATDHSSVAALVANPDRVVDVPSNQIAALLASLAYRAREAGGRSECADDTAARVTKCHEGRISRSAPDR
jgi:hypothetical protein